MASTIETKNMSCAFDDALGAWHCTYADKKGESRSFDAESLSIDGGRVEIPPARSPISISGRTILQKLVCHITGDEGRSAVCRTATVRAKEV